MKLPKLPPSPFHSHRLLAFILLAAVGISPLSTAATLDENRCGVLNPPGQFGPFDYRSANSATRSIVEGAHFTSDVELLVRGNTSNVPGPDIDYTLRAFPNHPRALKSMMDLGFRDKTARPRGTRWTVDCYFNRAIRFAPDDPTVRMVFGVYLLRSGEKKSAVEQLEIASSIGAASGNFHYNLGLAYFQVQDYEKARLQAYKARELGYELGGLKNMLTRVGQWREKAPESIPKDAQGAPTEKAPESVPQNVPDSPRTETVTPKD